MKLLTLKKIYNKKLCIGCGICKSLFPDKINLAWDEYGFYEPEEISELTRTELSEINKICPGTNLNINYDGDQNSFFWGKINSISTGYSSDEEIRFKAASGGALSGFLQFLLEEKKIKKILQIGANRDFPSENKSYISLNRNDILKNAGSRYSPSNPLCNLMQSLNNRDSKVAIVGKPCDILAVNNFLEIFPEFKNNIYVKISFFCAGMPSQNATRQLLKELGNKDESNISDFWYRGNGWPGYATVVQKNGTKNSISYDDSWGKILNRDLHFRCKICPDGVGSLADITFADAWELENNKPEFSERPGKSLIILRKDFTAELLTEAENKNFIIRSEFNSDLLKLIQPHQYSKKQLSGIRFLALRLSGEFFPKLKINSMLKHSYHAEKKLVFKNFFGMLRRSISR